MNYSINRTHSRYTKNILKSNWLSISLRIKISENPKERSFPVREMVGLLSENVKYPEIRRKLQKESSIKTTRSLTSLQNPSKRIERSPKKGSSTFNELEILFVAG